MVDHAALIRDFFGPVAGLSPGMVGLEDWEGLFNHLKPRETITGRCSARHFLSIRQASAQGGLGNIFWSPGMGDPVDGLAEVRSDMAPLLRLLESGKFSQGSLCPLTGIQSKEAGGSWLPGSFRPVFRVFLHIYASRGGPRVGLRVIPPQPLMP